MGGGVKCPDTKHYEGVQFNVISIRISLNSLWSTEDQWENARLAIEGALVRIPSATVSKFGHFRPLHDVHSAV